MLRRRLTLALTLAVGLAACGGADGTSDGAIRENVIEPGITAIDEADEFACDTDRRTLDTAVEAYQALTGDPAPDEATLVEAGIIREQSDLWDVVDGEVVAQVSACDDVAPVSPTTVEIVTETEALAPPTVDSILAGLSADDIASVGGLDCTRQLASSVVGVGSYERQEGVQPDSIGQVEAAGLLPEAVALWRIVDHTLRPVDGSDCVDLEAASTTGPTLDDCTTDQRTLEVAVEAYFARTGQLPASEQALVDSFFLRNASENFDLDADAQPVPAAGGNCS